MIEYIQVLTTVEHRTDAENIAEVLVQKRLAACVQIIGPMKSYFHWQGKLESAEEYLCQIKTKNDLFQELETVLKNIHPYEVPEILAIPLSNVGGAYRNWLASELKA